MGPWILQQHDLHQEVSKAAAMGLKTVFPGSKLAEAIKFCSPQVRATLPKPTVQCLNCCQNFLCSPARIQSHLYGEDRRTLLHPSCADDASCWRTDSWLRNRTTSNTCCQSWPQLTWLQTKALLTMNFLKIMLPNRSLGTSWACWTRHLKPLGIHRGRLQRRCRSGMREALLLHCKALQPWQVILHFQWVACCQRLSESCPPFSLFDMLCPRQSILSIKPERQILSRTLLELGKETRLDGVADGQIFDRSEGFMFPRSHSTCSMTWHLYPWWLGDFCTKATRLLDSFERVIQVTFAWSFSLNLMLSCRWIWNQLKWCETARLG